MTRMKVARSVQQLKRRVTSTEVGRGRHQEYRRGYAATLRGGANRACTADITALRGASRAPAAARPDPHAAERERISRASSRHRKTLAAIATTPTVMTNGSTGA